MSVSGCGGSLLDHFPQTLVEEYRLELYLARLPLFHGAVVLALVLGLAPWHRGLARSDSEPQTIKLSCALDSLIDLPPATEQSKYNARRHKVQEGIAEEVARVPYWYLPPPPTWVA